MKTIVSSLASLALAAVVQLAVVPKAAAQYTPAQQKAVSAVIGSLTPDVPKTLDTRDPTQATYLQSQFPGVNLARDLKMMMGQITATPIANVHTIKQAVTTAHPSDIVDITSIGVDPRTGTVTASGLANSNLRRVGHVVPS
jgi:hypothetical protein